MNKLHLTSLVGTLLCVATVNAAVVMKDETGKLGVPADYSQFQAILSQSKLQISDPNGKRSNKVEIAQDSNFTGVVSEYFYVDKKSEAFVFKMSGDHLRNELRVHENFRTDLADTTYRLSAKLEPINPVKSMANSDITQNEITYLQVHNKGTSANGAGNVPHPLLRVVWRQGEEPTAGHYWAVVKNNALICKGKAGEENKNNPECKAGNAYKNYDLGAMTPGVATQFDVIVGQEKLIVNVNGETKVDHNIDYWKHLLSYFKAGVYNQFSHGESEAKFYQLEYVVEKTN